MGLHKLKYFTERRTLVKIALLVTDKIANKSWELFQEIEKQGGFLSCIENGFIKNSLKQVIHVQ